MLLQIKATTAGSYTAYVSKSDRQMKSWSDPYNIVNFCTTSGGVRGIYSCNDEWFLAYYTNSDSQRTTGKIRSTKNGLTWTREASASGMTVDGVVKFNNMYIAMGSNGWSATPTIHRYTTSWIPIGGVEEPWSGRSCECCFIVNGVMCALENSYNNSLSRLFVSNDGYTFTPIAISSSGSIVTYAHNSKSGMILYASNRAFRIYDGTNLSSLIYPPNDVSSASYTDIRVDYIDGMVLLTAELNEYMYTYVSFDMGSHWVKQSIPKSYTTTYDTRHWDFYNNAVVTLSGTDDISLVTPTASKLSIGTGAVFI